MCPGLWDYLLQWAGSQTYFILSRVLVIRSRANTLPQPVESACGHSRPCGPLAPAAAALLCCSSALVSGEQIYPTLNMKNTPNRKHPYKCQQNLWFTITTKNYLTTAIARKYLYNVLHRELFTLFPEHFLFSCNLISTNLWRSHPQ